MFSLATRVALHAAAAGNRPSRIAIEACPDAVAGTPARRPFVGFLARAAALLSGGLLLAVLLVVPPAVTETAPDDAAAKARKSAAALEPEPAKIAHDLAHGRRAHFGAAPHGSAPSLAPGMRQAMCRTPSLCSKG